MAYNNNPPRAEYTASAAQTVFPFLFKIFTSADIKVYQTPVGQLPNDVTDLLTLTTDYTVSINGDAGGEITLVSGATNGDKITLLRSLEITRNIEYQNQGDLTAATLNLDQEYQTYLIADREAIDERFIKLSENAQGVSNSLPAPVSNAYMRWNALANAIENDTTIPDAVTTSAANAIQAQLREWEAEADVLTALSYASEAEDVLVNLVTSDGDGTFTYTPQTGIYSAKHHQLKAAVFNPALYATLSGATFTGQVKGIAPVAIEDLTRKDYVDTKAPLASPALTGNPTAPTAASSVKTTQIATTAYSNSLVAETTISGAAATSIDFTGLDIGTHKSYRIEIENVNNAANSYIYMFANGDTTVSNYSEEDLYGISASPGSQALVTPRVAFCKTISTIATADVTVKQVGGYVTFSSYNFSEITEIHKYAGRTNATKTNLTQLTFTHSVANGFGIGSKIRIYRGDV